MLRWATAIVPPSSLISVILDVTGASWGAAKVWRLRACAVIRFSEVDIRPPKTQAAGTKQAPTIRAIPLWSPRMKGGSCSGPRNSLRVTTTAASSPIPPLDELFHVEPIPYSSRKACIGSNRDGWRAARSWQSARPPGSERARQRRHQPVGTGQTRIQSSNLEHSDQPELRTGQTCNRRGFRQMSKNSLFAAWEYQASLADLVN